MACALRMRRENFFAEEVEKIEPGSRVYDEKKGGDIIF